ADLPVPAPAPLAGVRARRLYRTTIGARCRRPAWSRAAGGGGRARARRPGTDRDHTDVQGPRVRLRHDDRTRRAARRRARPPARAVAHLQLPGAPRADRAPRGPGATGAA